MSNHESYRPVSCDLYDHLEIAAMRRLMIHIIYNDNGCRKEKRTTIKNLYARDGAEFLECANGEEIRLDRLIKILDGDGTLIVSFEDGNLC